MKVKELMEALSQMDPEANVYTGSSPNGLSDVWEAFTASIVRNYHCSYTSADHEQWEKIRECDKKPGRVSAAEVGVIVR